MTWEQGEPRLAALIATALSVGVLAASALLDVDGPRWLTMAGLGLLVAAAGLVIRPFWDLHHYGQPAAGRPYFATTRLVHQGIFRFVRHPQYLGYVLLTLGFAALTPHWLVIGLAGGTAVGFAIQALQEEAYLYMQFGDAYRDYARRVPRFNVLRGLWRVLRR